LFCNKTFLLLFNKKVKNLFLSLAMKDITLVIPAKSESNSLPKVLNELKKFSVKKIIVIPKNDILTFKSAKKYNCKIIFQKKKWIR